MTCRSRTTSPPRPRYATADIIIITTTTAAGVLDIHVVSPDEIRGATHPAVGRPSVVKV